MTSPPDTAIKEQRDATEAILALLFLNNRVQPGASPGLNAESEMLLKPEVQHFVRRNAPLELVLPAFPAKSPNLQKVLGTLPDLAEKLALSRLSHLLDSVSLIYSPGARLLLASDGHVFADVVGVPDSHVHAYRAALRGHISDPRISWLDLEGAFGQHAPETLRRELLAKYREPMEALRCRAKQLPELADQVNGIHRFLFEDERGISPEISRNQARPRTRQRAYEVVRRGEAWSALLRPYFPRAVRLSIHPQRIPSMKIGVHLMGVEDPWLTPWHGVAVVSAQGIQLMRRSKAERLGARVAFQEGAPSHMDIS